MKQSNSYQRIELFISILAISALILFNIIAHGLFSYQTLSLILSILSIALCFLYFYLLFRSASDDIQPKRGCALTVSALLLLPIQFFLVRFIVQQYDAWFSFVFGFEVCGGTFASLFIAGGFLSERKFPEAVAFLLLMALMLIIPVYHLP